MGVTIHIGTAEHGHYYSLINTKRGSEEVEENKPEWQLTEKDTWKQFEDDKIKHYSFSDLKLDAFGGNQSANMADNEINAYLTSSGGSFGKNAYMLVYERMKKVPLVELVEEEATLDCVDTASSRAAEESASLEEGSVASPARGITQKLVDFRKV